MKYSIVVPIYNDARLAAAFCRETDETFRKYLGHDDISKELEVIFVDDGSSNDSPEVLKDVCDKFPFARMVAFSRNFGHHIAISAGYAEARGDFVGMMNVDQEDPPSQMVVLLDEIKKGTYDIVGGLYSQRNVRLGNRVTSYLFHATMMRLTGYKYPINAATIRVMTRKSIDTYNRLTERTRYLPGLEVWLGFRYGYVPTEHRERRDGKSSYNFRRRLRLAIASLISFSDFPLRLAVKFGMAVAGGGLVFAVAVIVDKLLRNVLPGYASTLAAIVFFGGVQIAVTGVASLYVGRILAEVQGRPLYVVRETYGGLPAEER